MPRLGRSGALHVIGKQEFLFLGDGFFRNGREIGGEA
jgi:hypothetical protein